MHVMQAMEYKAYMLEKSMRATSPILGLRKPLDLKHRIVYLIN